VRNFSLSQLRQLAIDLESLASSEACARYLLLHLHARHPRQWLSSPRMAAPMQGQGLLNELQNLEVTLSAKQSARLEGLGSLKGLVQSYYFRGVVLDSHEGLVGWLEGRYPLHLRQNIPSPDEMLAIQCQGQRYVTLLLQEDAQFQKYGRHADACAFLLHDFEHAHKFFSTTHSGQVQFFQHLQRSLNRFTRWSEDPQFQDELDYLKSDMNSHPVHLIKYLKAIVLSAEMRKTSSRWPKLDEFWHELFAAWQMAPSVREAALKINQPESETQSDLVTVSDFFMPVGEIACEPPRASAT
jgi:hypothetical protein